MLAIHAKLHEIAVFEDVRKDEAKEGTLAKMQALVRGKRGRREAEHMKMLNSQDFAEEFYQEIVQV